MKWSTADKEFIRQNYATMPIDHIVIELGRTKAAIRYRAHKLNLRRVKNWTQLEDIILKESFNTLTHDQIAGALTRSPKAVSDRARRLKITRAWARRWTAKEHDYLICNYEKQTSLEISTHLGRSLVAVQIRKSLLRHGNKLPIAKIEYNPFITGKIGGKPNLD